MASGSTTVTQKDIAKRVGVTQQSVALALKGHHSVSTDTRRRIEQVATELGYDRLGNAGARALIARRYGKQIKTGIIAVALAAGGTPMRGMPFFSPILDGIEQYAGQHGLDVYLWYHIDERPVPRLIRDKGVDGVIFLANTMLQPLANELVNTVSITHNDGNYVSIDDKEATRNAVRHLAEIGHKRIAYLGWDDSSVAGIQRHAGFRSGLADCGLPVDETLIDTTLFHFQTLPINTEEFIRKAPQFTALVCYNDMVAMAAVRTMERMGIRVPDDVSVVGIDDLSVESNFQPALTSVGYDRVAMGACAAKMVNELADRFVETGHTGHKPAYVHEILPVHLVARESTKPL